MKIFLIYFLLFLLNCVALNQLYIANFAGNGTQGYSGEYLPATSSQIVPNGIW
jgi:hypothetical protein